MLFEERKAVHCELKVVWQHRSCSSVSLLLYPESFLLRVTYRDSSVTIDRDYDGRTSVQHYFLFTTLMLF